MILAQAICGLRKIWKRYRFRRQLRQADREEMAAAKADRAREQET